MQAQTTAAEQWIPDNGKTEIDAGIFKLADKLRALKEEKKTLENREKEVNAEIETVNDQMVAQMIDEEMQNFSRSGQTFYLYRKIFASAVPEKKPDLFSWLRKEGHGDMIQETVNAQTLAAFVRELLDENEDDKLPEDLDPLLNVTRKQTIGMRKAAGGKKK
jgi:hypothetical protein